MLRLWHVALVGLMILSGQGAPRAAESGEVRIIQIAGLSYLPLIVAVDRKMIETEMAKRGLPNGKASLILAGSGASANEMLLTGSAEVAVGGVTVQMTLWDKTRGRNEVRGISSLCDAPVYLTTIDPRIKSIRDYRDGDKIAVTAIKVTMQALSIEMAASKEWGWDERFRLDPLTLSMSHPDSVLAMLSDRLEIKSYVATVPFNFQVAADPRVRTIYSSYDVMGGPHTTSSAWTTKSWKEGNPQTYAALVAAIDNALAEIARDKRAAAEIYLAHEKSSFTLDQVVDILNKEDSIKYTKVPHRTKEIADFMYKVGTLKNAPADWKDLFWENLHDQPGS